MDTTLEKLFSSLEDQRKNLLTEIQSINAEKLNHRTNNKWSISEIVGHLVTAERLSVGYINKKINAINEVDNTGLVGEIKLLVFILSQRLPIKYKAPANLGDKPKSYPDLATLENDWVETRQEMKKLLEGFPSTGLKKEIYRHPVMGRSNIGQALIFFREHIIHHYPQIRRQL